LRAIAVSRQETAFMSYRPFSRGVSAGALALVLIPAPAPAQQSLPTIDIGAARNAAPRLQRAQAADRSMPDATQGASTLRETRDPQTPTEGYVVDQSSTATRTSATIKETPAAVIVVPQQAMKDQQNTQLKEALENVSGVRSNNNELEGYNFKIRGFQSLVVFRNGLALGDAGTAPVDTANIERIEVLKGPASILYGRIEPGGLVNIVTKQPLDRPRYSVEQQFGSYDHYRTEWDFTAPVKDIPGLAYRLSGAYQNTGSFRAYQDGERVMVAPVVSYKPSDWTAFTLDTQFVQARAQSDAGVPGSGPFGPLPAPVPLNRSFQEPNDPRDRASAYNVSYRFMQKLEENWTFTHNFLYTESWLHKRNIINAGVEADNLTYDRITNAQDHHALALSTNLNMEGKFEALAAKHDLLFGLDYQNSYYDYFLGVGDVYPISLYAPIYGAVPQFAFWNAQNGTTFKQHTSVLTRQRGLYVQEQATWFDRLHVLLGARYDIASVVGGQCQSSGGAGDYSASKNCAIADRLRARERIDTGWSPRVGLTLDITPEVSAYTSYSRSFGVNNGLSAAGEPLAPQKALQWEAGLKAQVFSGVSATLAVFQITKSNVPIQDVTSPGAMRLGGLQRSRGVEFDVVGAVTDRLSVIANYAYIDAKVIADNAKDALDPFDFNGLSGQLGNHLDNVPRHSGKIFATYDFGRDGLGWRVGAGVTAATHAWADVWNTVLQPGWARVDAMASYAVLVDGHKLTAQLNLRNLNNARYYEGADNFFQPGPTPPPPLFPARPFTATGTIKVEF
jgi:iron complex outermembrane recepter protein